MRVWAAVPGIALLPCLLFAQVTAWNGYGGDPQHTATSSVPSQSLTRVHWSTPVDLNPQLGGGVLFTHYGSPMVTTAGTVIVPVKTGATGGFELMAFQKTGTPFYTLATDYISPAHNWIPPYSPSLGVNNTVYYPGAGGTVYYRTAVDSATGTTGQWAFYGMAQYNANPSAFKNTVQISTPITTDSAGTLYFGFVVTGSNPAGLTSGIARITSAGAGSWMPVSSFGTGNPNITSVAANAGPVLSIDQKTLYVPVSGDAEFSSGYLVALNSSTLVATANVALLDPRGGVATVSADSSASPMVGSDGDVYFGVLEGSCCTSHNDRGWMLHYDATLTQTKIPGSFGWDTTPSVVPASAVPSYRGSSPYLILTKYNNYAGVGSGTGVNQVAILDPRTGMLDKYSSTSVTVMQEVLTIAGATTDPRSGYPNAVREWCINIAAVDPFSKSALVNSEDGTLYRWDFTTNSFSQKISLTGGLGEAYTPTVIGADGTVYAINDAKLFAVGGRLLRKKPRPPLPQAGFHPL